MEDINNPPPEEVEEEWRAMEVDFEPESDYDDDPVEDFEFLDSEDDEEEDVEESHEEGGEPSSSSLQKAECHQGNQSGVGEIEPPEGAYCPICMQTWSSDGTHQISCLPCGHVYGLSCIQRWVQQKGNRSKCPQCSRKCKQKDVIKLYVSRTHVTDGIEEKIESRMKEVEEILTRKMDDQIESRINNLKEELITIIDEMIDTRMEKVHEDMRRFMKSVTLQMANKEVSFDYVEPATEETVHETDTTCNDSVRPEDL